MERIKNKYGRILSRGTLLLALTTSRAVSAGRDTSEVMGKLNSGLTQLGSQMHDIISGPVAAIIALVLIVLASFKMGATALHAVIIGVVGGILYLAIAPQLVWTIFGSGV